MGVVIRPDWRLHPAAVLERVRARAYPGKEMVELNSALRHLRRLLDADSGRRGSRYPRLRVLNRDDAA